MKYNFDKQDLLDFVSAFGYETREKGDELNFRRCPYCSGGSNHDEWTFSVNVGSGAYKCLRSSCNQSGFFIELCRDMNYQIAGTDISKNYRQLPQREPESSQEAVAYMASRGISEQTTRLYRITTQRNKPGVLVFPFYDENGYLTFVKYRKTKFRQGVDKNKEWCESDAKPILFGMNHCYPDKPLIITEGQIDSLSVIEAGIPNAVSVPTGATGFTWLGHCIDWLKQFKTVIVFGDCEKGKITLLDTLLARLPKETVVKAVRICDYLTCKDANEILCNYGSSAVRKCIENAEIPKLDNVKQLADVQSVDINKLDKIPTGIMELDRCIRGMAMGQLVILTGKRGEGKSTLMSQIICEALDQNRNVFVYSGELADFHFKRWLDYQLAGDANLTPFQNKYGDTEYGLDRQIVDDITDWYRGRAFIYDNNFISDGSSEFETLPETIEKVILQYNTQLICIDNLMTAMERVDDQNNLFLAQSNFVGKLKALAVKYSVVILLVAHPKKGDANAFQDDNDLVAGSSDITNKADIIIKYQRAPQDFECSSLIKLTKNRIMGTLRTVNANAIQVNYSAASKRITGVDEAPKVYRWEKNRNGLNDGGELPF